MNPALPETLGFFEDPIIWYSLALIIFLGVFYIFARKPVLHWLDGQIAALRHELAEAERLRTEAEASLAAFRQRQQDALSEAEAILSHAKDEAARLSAAAAAELKTLLQRREQQALQRIAEAEAEATDDVRQAVIAEAMNIAREKLRTAGDAKLTAQLADRAIAALPDLNKAA